MPDADVRFCRHPVLRLLTEPLAGFVVSVEASLGELLVSPRVELKHLSERSAGTRYLLHVVRPIELLVVDVVFPHIHVVVEDSRVGSREIEVRGMVEDITFAKKYLFVPLRCCVFEPCENLQVHRYRTPLAFDDYVIAEVDWFVARDRDDRKVRL